MAKQRGSRVALLGSCLSFLTNKMGPKPPAHSSCLEASEPCAEYLSWAWRAHGEPGIVPCKVITWNRGRRQVRRRPSWGPQEAACSLRLLPASTWGATALGPRGHQWGGARGPRAGGGARSEQVRSRPTGAPADAAGGEAAHDWHGAAGGALRRLPGALQRPERLPVQTGAWGSPPAAPQRGSHRSWPQSPRSEQPRPAGGMADIPRLRCGRAGPLWAPVGTEATFSLSRLLGRKEPRVPGSRSPGWAQGRAGWGEPPSAFQCWPFSQPAETFTYRWGN